MGVIHRKKPGVYDWEDTVLVTYDKPSVRGVTKRVLIGRRENAPGFAMRYFEVRPGGSSSLESHPEIHEVFILHGSGKVLMGDTHYPLNQGDVVYIEPNEQHQFLASENEALGFICVAPRHENQVG